LRYVKDLEKKLDWQTFRTTVHRVDKNYPSTSQEYEKAFGEIIFEYYKTKNNCKKGAVNLTNPDIEIVFEMLNEKIVFYVKMNGIGGLPVSSSGKAIVLLSGGFDSPVAAYMLAKRGVRIVGIHFHGIPKTSKKSLVKVRDIAKVLSIYTGSVDLYVIPIISAMEVIAIDAKQDSLRLILLRRLMNRVAERIAERIGGGAIITGESVGQVASQTLENMRATAEPVSYPVLRPLCGMNKNEIIAIARKIGTHDISVRPHDDTCVEFVPKKPETRANLQDVHRALESYDEDLLIEELLKKMSIESF
jgi:thiamine biosynthesis protein ThiI